jgi:uncharacterized protein
VLKLKEYPLFFFHYENITAIIEAALAGKKEVNVSLNLNLSRQDWQIENNELILQPDLCIDITEFESLALVTNKIFILNDKKALTPLEIRSTSYYKLVPTDTVPILEIDGIKMHRTKDITPLQDAENKTQKVISRGGMVLDTCSGLGYTAIFAMKAGAHKVISTEISQEVIQLRSLNPWLAYLHNRQPEFINADIRQYIEQIEDNYFHSIIHDPPRFTSKTGDLYGKKFYSALFRVMINRGKLFHYTGSPKKVTQKDRFVKNAIKRLEDVGFTKVLFDEQLQGIVAEKKELRMKDE